LFTAVATLLLVAPSLRAEELRGRIVKVDASAQSITVVPDGAEAEILVNINEETTLATPKKSGKLDLKKLGKQLDKVLAEGKKGIAVTITHEKALASKVETGKRKNNP
jgi:hypothetical protein